MVFPSKVPQFPGIGLIFRDVTELSSIARQAVALPGLVTGSLITPRISFTFGAVHTLISRQTPAFIGSCAKSSILVTPNPADGLVAEVSFISLITDTFHGPLTRAKYTLGEALTNFTELAIPAWVAVALPRNAACSMEASFLADGFITEHPSPSFFTSALEWLATISIETAWQTNRDITLITLPAHSAFTGIRCTAVAIDANWVTDRCCAVFVFFSPSRKADHCSILGTDVVVCILKILGNTCNLVPSICGCESPPGLTCFNKGGGEDKSKDDS